jgi:hypothetical protein
VPRADNLTTFICRLSSDSRSVNLLDIHGPAQAGNGIASILNVSEEILKEFYTR